MIRGTSGREPSALYLLTLMPLVTVTLSQPAAPAAGTTTTKALLAATNTKGGGGCGTCYWSTCAEQGRVAASPPVQLAAHFGRGQGWAGSHPLGGPGVGVGAGAGRRR